MAERSQQLDLSQSASKVGEEIAEVDTIQRVSAPAPSPGGWMEHGTPSALGPTVPSDSR